MLINICVYFSASFTHMIISSSVKFILVIGQNEMTVDSAQMF